MSDLTITIVLVIIVFIVYSPVYLQRRKNWRIADEDLKKIDYEGWKRQLKSNAYINLISRIIWGLFLLSLFVFNLQKIFEQEFFWLPIVVIGIGILSIVWAILGFRREIRNIDRTA